MNCMRNIWIFCIFGLFLIPITAQQSNGLIQFGGAEVIEISPGETKTFEWQLKSSDEKPISLDIGSYGWGSQFFSYPDTLNISANEIGTLKVTVTIPADHPGGVQLEPRVTATQFGEEGAQTTINVRAAKIVQLSILQNENSEFWSNTAYDEPVPEVMEESESPQVTESIEKEKPSANPLQIGNPQTKSQEEGGGGCLIATATFGTELATQVQMLREIRDNNLLITESGSTFLTGFNILYYSFSPTIADMERQSPIFRESVKVTITPLLASLSLLNNVDTNSEEKVLVYGISLILLNAGMYFVVPTIIIVKIRKRFLKNF